MRWRDPDCEHHPTINVSGPETLKNLINRPAVNKNRTALPESIMMAVPRLACLLVAAVALERWRARA